MVFTIRSTSHKVGAAGGIEPAVRPPGRVRPMGETAVPKKLYYRIGEACRAVDIQPYVLRYWETEFDALAPGKSKSGQRVYTEEELGIIRRIKELLYEEGYTIAGAKKRLLAELEDGRSFAAPAVDGELFEAEESAADDVPVIAVEPAIQGAEMAPEEIEPVPPATVPEENAVDADAPLAEARRKRRAKNSPHTRGSKEAAEATVEAAAAKPAVAQSAVVDLLPGGHQREKIAGGSVDSALSERVETLEHGLRRVLSEVRHLRDLLAGSSDDR